MKQSYQIYRVILIYLFFMLSTPAIILFFDNHTRNTQLFWSFTAADLNEMEEIKMGMFQFVLSHNDISTDDVVLRGGCFINCDVEKFFQSVTKPEILDVFYKKLLINISQMEHFAEIWEGQKFHITLFTNDKEISYSKKLYEEKFNEANAQMVELIKNKYSDLLRLKILYIKEAVKLIQVQKRDKKSDMLITLKNHLIKFEEIKKVFSSNDTQSPETIAQVGLINRVIDDLLYGKIFLEQDMIVHKEEELLIRIGGLRYKNFEKLLTYSSTINDGLLEYNKLLKKEKSLELSLKSIAKRTIDLNNNFKFLAYYEPNISNRSIFGGLGFLSLIVIGLLSGFLIASTILILNSFTQEMKKNAQ